MLCFERSLVNQWLKSINTLPYRKSFTRDSRFPCQPTKAFLTCTIPEYSTIILISPKFLGMQGKCLPPPCKARIAPAKLSGRKKFSGKQRSRKWKWKLRGKTELGEVGGGDKEGGPAQQMCDSRVRGRKEREGCHPPSIFLLPLPAIMADACYHQH